VQPSVCVRDLAQAGAHCISGIVPTTADYCGERVSISEVFNNTRVYLGALLFGRAKETGGQGEM